MRFIVFVRTKNYDILAGVLLALTGCEAMFARFVTNSHAGEILLTLIFQP